MLSIMMTLLRMMKIAEMLMITMMMMITVMKMLLLFEASLYINMMKRKMIITINLLKFVDNPTPSQEASHYGYELRLFDEAGFAYRGPLLSVTVEASKFWSQVFCFLYI